MNEPPRPPSHTARAAKAQPFGVSVARASGSEDPLAPTETPPTDTALSLEALVAGVRSCDCGVLARAISLVESSNPEHRALAEQLLERLAAARDSASGDSSMAAATPAPDSIRVGITGVPGAGKSTFIERLGVLLCEQGERVAVLAVDPSSIVSGGSILGDRTRMAKLATLPNAFIRPSASRGSLGGVAPRTREVIRVCEAAGFGIVLVETVGVGQSEAMIADLVDCVLALALPNAGDELQGLKRGLLENVDVIVVNKADGENADAAKLAASQLRASLSLLRRSAGGASSGSEGIAAVSTCSAATGQGVEDVWALIRTHIEREDAAGRLALRRCEQDVRWMRALVEERLLARLRESAPVREALINAEDRVRKGQESPSFAADSVIQVMFGTT